MTTTALPAQAPVTTPTSHILGVLIFRTALLFAAVATIFGVGRIWSPQTPFADQLIWTNVAIVAIDVVTIVLVARLVHREGGRVVDLIKFRISDIGWGLLATLILAITFLITSFIGNLVAYGGPPPRPDHIPHIPLWLGLWSLLLMPLTIAFAEELSYRGYAQSRLSARWGKWLALIVVAVGFGAQHIPLSFTSPQDALARFVTTMLTGLVFGLMVWWFKRLGPVIIGHWLIDVIGLGLPMMMGALS